MAFETLNLCPWSPAQFFPLHVYDAELTLLTPDRHNRKPGGADSVAPSQAASTYGKTSDRCDAAYLVIQSLYISQQKLVSTSGYSGTYPETPSLLFTAQSSSSRSFWYWDEQRRCKAIVRNLLEELPMAKQSLSRSYVGSSLNEFPF